MLKLNIALYLRLSLDDECEGESASISGQRELILGELKSIFKDSEYEVFEFFDDGHTGTNFNRPGVISMLDAIRNGNINCVIVKDLSRFGRNYVEVGNYLERVFPFLGVRFISINDNYDSSSHKGSTGDLDIPFRNLLYDLYSKDMSRKILSSKDMKRKKGEIATAYTPYGYLKDKSNKMTLLIDDIAAEIVKRIFNDILLGKSTGQIAKALNAENILTPMRHKHNMGISSTFNAGDKENIWTATSVRVIVKDERYIGKFIGGKTQSRIANNKKMVCVPRSQWVVIPDRLPIIIPQDVFLKANEMIVGSKSTTYKSNEDRLFSKKIRCACCGLLFRRKDQVTAYYFCSTPKYSEKECYDGKLREADLSKILLPIMQSHLKIAVSFNKMLSKEKQLFEEKIHQKESALKRIQDNIKKSENMSFELYEKYLERKISKDEFLAKKDKIQKQLAKDEDYSSQLRQDLELFKMNASKSLDIVEAYSKYDYITEVTKELVDRLVDIIIVNSDGSLEISFKYRNPLEIAK